MIGPATGHLLRVFIKMNLVEGYRNVELRIGHSMILFSTPYGNRNVIQ